MDLPVEIWADMQEDQGHDTATLRMLLSYDFADAGHTETNYEDRTCVEDQYGDGSFCLNGSGDGLYFMASGNGISNYDQRGTRYQFHGDG